MTKNNKIIIWALSLIAVLLCAILFFMLGTQSSRHSLPYSAKKTSKTVNQGALTQSSTKPQSDQAKFTNEEIATMALADLGQAGTIDQKLADVLTETTDQVDPRQEMLMQIKPLSDNSFQFQEGTARSTRLIITINGDTVDHKISDMLREHSESSMNKADLVSRYRDKQAQVDAIIQKINYNDQHTTEINQKLMEDVVSGKDD